MSAYLLRFCQSVMSGYFSAIHGGTYQPMMPSLPVLPAICTDPWPSTYFLIRSSWPQFSTTVSMSPEAMPCQPTSSLTSGYVTLQPSSPFATCPITRALETYPVHGFTAIRRSPQSVPPEDEVLLSSMSPPPQAVRPKPTTAARATSRVRADPGLMMLFPFFGSATAAEKL